MSPIADPDDYAGQDRFEIVKEWYQEEGGVAYLRMDLADNYFSGGPPIGGDTWGVYVDRGTIPTPGTNAFVAPGLDGIDYRVTFRYFGGGYSTAQERWNGAAWVAAGGSSDITEAKILQWSLPITWSGGVHTTAATFNGAALYDSMQLNTLEPGVLSLFGIGLGVVCCRRRRRVAR
ncbi:MAG: hypothetical protein GW892_03240 [Armatimonadetes bacterium]|nr:hypothetical protein [Armatimonadota bacterium]NCQ26617.1 hypothetical protein [Armatimonadota bacterium]